MRFAEYFDAFRGSQWLELLLKLDVIRQAAIPFRDTTMNSQYTPLGCVTRVHSVNLLSETPQDHKLSIRVNLDAQGSRAMAKRLADVFAHYGRTLPTG